jgi:hypothetical protein
MWNVGDHRNDDPIAHVEITILKALTGSCG